MPSIPSVYVAAMDQHPPKSVVEEGKILDVPVVIVAGMGVAPAEQVYDAPATPTPPAAAVPGEGAATKSAPVATHDPLDLDSDFARGWMDGHRDGFDAAMALVCPIHFPSSPRWPCGYAEFDCGPLYYE